MNINLVGAVNMYGLLIGLGAVACILIAYFIAKKRGYYEDFLFELVICCLPLGIIGARTYYIIFDLIEKGNFEYWTFSRIIGLEGGLSGLAIYGGIIGGALGVALLYFINRALYKKNPVKYAYRNMSFVQIADVAFCVVLLGQGVGRWGNFFNQEAYGNIVTNPSLQWFPYAVFIDAENAWYQATFFYESAWDLIGFALLLWSYAGKYKSFDGFTACQYFIFYGMGRMVIEGFRSDSLWLIPGQVRVSQLLSGILLFVGIALVFLHVILARKNGKQPFIYIKENDLDGNYYGYDKSRIGKQPLESMKASDNNEVKFEEVDDSDKYWEIPSDNHSSGEKNNDSNENSDGED